MLIVISDLHLTDCSTATSPRAEAFELLAGEIQDAIREKDAGEAHVVLLGDVFDVVRTDWWCRTDVPLHRRPWGGELDERTAMNASPETERQFQAILSAVLDGAASRALIAGLQSLRDRDGKPPRITYVRGNHDRVLANFPSLQQRIAEAFAPLFVDFRSELHAPEYGVFARHGHEWDPDCHGWKLLTRVLDPGSDAGRFSPEAYRVMAIGEVIAAELVSGFVWHASSQLREADDEPFRKMIEDVNNLRPMTDVVRWMVWLGARAQHRRRLEIARQAFQAALEATLESSVAKAWDRLKPDLLVTGDVTDYLSKVLRIVRRKGGLDWLETITPLADELQSAAAWLWGKREDPLYAGASAEYHDETVPEDTQYLLYGHTHVARQNCISALPDGRVRMYVNTGTFLPLIERADDKKSFYRSHRMSYVTFCREDEDREDRRGTGPTMNVWDGLMRKEYR